jgi:hypothetical protein
MIFVYATKHIRVKVYLGRREKKAKPDPKVRLCWFWFRLELGG